MVERLLYYERELFLLLNSPHSPQLDTIMLLHSQTVIWAPVLVLMMYLLFMKRTHVKQGLLILMLMVIVIALCDQFASGLCKPFFARLRPTHHPSFFNVVKTVHGYRGGRLGFISSHACISFGFATFVVRLFKNKYFTFVVFLWATINAYSRIYLGVHFVSDVVLGAFAGVMIGRLCSSSLCPIAHYILRISDVAKNQTYLLLNKHAERYMAFGLLATFLVIILFSQSLLSLLGK